MADEAYRGVFLRVHPTGKMVLSLTTESDGRESQYAQLVADELGVPPLDVKVVPADTDRFGVGHGYNTSPSEGTSAAVVSASGKIRAKAQLLAGAALGAAPDTLTWVNGAWADGDGSDPTQVKTLEEIALYAHCRHRRPAAGGRGRAHARPSTRSDPARRRWGSARRQADVDRELDLVGHLQGSEERRVGLDAPVALLDDDAAAEPSVIDRDVERDGPGRADEREVALHAQDAPVRGGLHQVERNSTGWPIRISSWIVCAMPALSSSSSACIPPVPSTCDGRQRDDRRRARSSVASLVRGSGVVVRPASASAGPTEVTCDRAEVRAPAFGRRRRPAGPSVRATDEASRVARVPSRYVPRLRC